MATFLVSLLNLIISALGGFVGSLISLLPNSPFTAIDDSPVASYLSGLNWILPIGTFVSITELWLTCIVAYYGYSLVLRWIKAVKG